MRQCGITSLVLFAALIGHGHTLRLLQNDVEAEVKEAGIIPDVISGLTTPLVPLTVAYDGTPIIAGDFLTPNETAVEPLVTIDGASPTSSYLLAVVDPDAPSPEEPTSANILHWLVADITNGDVGSGTELTPYRGPAPPTGVHRYIFLLWEQPSSGIAATLQDPTGAQFTDRRLFNVTEFIELNSLGNPSGVTYFTSSR